MRGGGGEHRPEHRLQAVGTLWVSSASRENTRNASRVVTVGWSTHALTVSVRADLAGLDSLCRLVVSENETHGARSWQDWKMQVLYGALCDQGARNTCALDYSHTKFSLTTEHVFVNDENNSWRKVCVLVGFMFCVATSQYLCLSSLFFSSALHSGCTGAMMINSVVTVSLLS